jgi:tripartite-type tricarboxylate transporter receptor subunit TctC
MRTHGTIRSGTASAKSSAFVLALVAMLAAPSLCAQEPFAGKTLKLIVGSAVGASYDSYARIVARHMSGRIPGRPRIVVQNLPGAEGLLAANNLYNLAERDGATFGVINRATVLASIIGNEQARYKSELFNWLGTTASFEDNAYLLVVRSALPIRTIDDLRNAPAPVHVGNSGSPLVSLLKGGLSLNVNIIEGYGKSDLDLAFERGEVDVIGIAYANLQARHPDWIPRNFIRVLVQFGRIERFSALPDVPTAREIARTEQEKGLIELAEASLLLAYPFALPPRVARDRVALMRQAFTETMQDAAYRDEVLKGKLDHSPKDGNAVQDIIARIANMSPATIARYKEIVMAKNSGG